MFNRTVPAAVEQTPTEVPPADLIPLSHLSLDVDEPAGGWAVYLAGRGIPVDFDDIGRPAVFRADARQLLDEQHEAAARKREALQRQEQKAIEADQAFRAQLNPGIPWWRLPDGMTPGDAMALAAAEANHQKSVQESLLEQELGGPQNSMIYQPLNDGAES